MPLLECKVEFCKGEHIDSQTFAPCERGGPCPRSVDLQSLKAAEVRRRTKTAVRDGNRDALASLLREAASAHHTWEQKYLDGQTDDDWPAWYASYLLGGVTE